MRLHRDLLSRASRRTLAMLMTWAWCGGADQTWVLLSQNHSAALGRGAPASRSPAARSFARRVVRLALVLALACSWCLGPHGAAWARASVGGAFAMPLPPREQWADAARATLTPASEPALIGDEVAERAERALRGINAVEYDYALRTRELGPGVEPVFEFVRDRVRFESYPGALRGAQVTYTTRAGNAVDRANLLAAMLRERGVPVRYARGELDAATAERLLARTFEPPLLRGNPPRAGGSLAGTSAILQRLRTRATRDYAIMRAALGDELPAVTGIAKEQLIKEIRSPHVWVQAQVDGTWTNLDPSLSDAKPGQRLCDAAETFDAIPASLEQRVTIRVVHETLQGDDIKQSPVLEFDAAARDLLGRQVFLVHSEGDPGVGAVGGVAGAIRAAQGGEVWTPALYVDGEWTIGTPVVFDDGAAAQPAKRGEPPRGGLGGAFGRGGALASAPAVTVAQWVEFIITFPDGTKDLTRRVLIDRADASWRAAPKPDAAKLRPLPRDAQGMTPPREVHNIWFTAGRHDLLAYAEAVSVLAQLNRIVTELAPPNDLPFEQQVWPFAVQNFGLLVLSEHVIVPSLNDDPDVRLYADAPRIVVVTTGPEPYIAKDASKDASEGLPPPVFVQIDLRRDKLRGVARDGKSSEAVLERKLWFAALEGALEHEVAARIGAATGWGEEGVGSTSARADGSGAAVVRPGKAPAETDLPADADAASRVRATVEAGATLVIPRGARDAADPGWWEVAPTGDARAVYAADANASRTPRVRGFPQMWGNKPNVRQPRGDPKVWKGWDPAKTPRPAAPKPGPTPQMFENARRVGDAIRNKTNVGPNPLIPAEKEKKTGATEYTAMIQFGRTVVGIAGFVLLHVFMFYGPTLLAGYLTDLLLAGLGVDQAGP